ncbi:uncharacterized protein Triagg1_3264 [Trichoderma aggressivum f. europaeum]|uniref:Ankyrin repeat protein n=1 Tax=Trichoderma aggressivum f. europaeum TaxID=173218 RepID=A0AAE1M4N7_9HYPO|nr:hypothetical protein Triagg1_3264 [Trichoderma aggressivum f. europaeum]
MTLEELKTAVSLLCNTPVDSTTIMRDQIASCGPILQSSEEQDTCSLVHQSARDYLLREEADSDPILEEFRIEAKEAHTSLVRICLACIENSDLCHRPLDITDASVLKKSPLLGYAVKHWPEHAKHADEDFDFSRTFFQKKDDARVHWWRAYGNGSEWHRHEIGTRPLYIASYLGINSLVREILQANAWRTGLEFRKYVNQRNEYGMTPLILAAGEGHHSVVQLLLANGADVDFLSEPAYWVSTALEAAAERGHTSVVQLLLAAGANPELPGNDMALHRAAEIGHAAIVQLLLDKGIDVNATTCTSRILAIWKTPLILAAGNGHEAIVRLLLNNGVDVNMKDEFGNTALQFAARNGHEAIVQLLLETGADVNTRATALSKAVDKGHEAIVRLLLANDVDAKLEDKALRRAAWGGNEAMVRFLLANSAHADIKGTCSMALIRAAERGHEHILRILLEKGADINARHTHHGIWYTALEMAARQGRTTTVQFLLANGARNISTKDAEKPSRTALEWAVRGEHEDIVQLLYRQRQSLRFSQGIEVGYVGRV